MVPTLPKKAKAAGSIDFIDYIKSINTNKVNLMRPPADPKAVSNYPAFNIRRQLSKFRDILFVVNEINCIPDLDSQMQYEFLLNAVPVGRRYLEKINKQTVAEEETVDLIKRVYHYSTAKALAVLPLHSKEDLERLRARVTGSGELSRRYKE